MEKIAIVGCGGFGHEVKTLIDQINKHTPCYNIIGFYDDSIELSKFRTIKEIPFLGNTFSINEVKEPLNIVIAIGEPKTKLEIVNKINNKFIKYPNLIHPSAIIEKSLVNIGKGNIITAGCILTCNIELKNFVILNLKCTVGHDSVISDYSSIMPAVSISGDVIVKEMVYIGTGAILINKLVVGDNSVIGAGAVVVKDVPDYAVVVGNPAKIIKYNKN